MSRRKAISPIIAIIILLLITISIAGAGYSYLSVYWTGMTSRQIEVINAFCLQAGDQGKILVKNIGTSVLNTSEIRVLDAQTGADLSQEALWESSVGDSGLVLHLRFEEGSGTTAYDSSGKDNHGTLKNASGAACFTGGACPEWAEGIRGGALEFDGDGDYLDCRNDTSLMPASGLTVSAWARSNTEDWNAHGWVVSLRDSDNNAMYIIHPNAGSNGIKGMIANGSGPPNSGWYSVGSGPPDITVWHHYALTYNGTGFTFYVDANNTGSRTNVTGNIDYTGPTMNLIIGSDSYNVNRSDRNGNGLIDEVRIYSRALSPEEIGMLASNAVLVQPGDKAILTQDCTGRCMYSLVLDGRVKEAMVQC